MEQFPLITLNQTKSNKSSNKSPSEKHDFKNIKGNKTRATSKQTSDGNVTFMIVNPMNKVYMDKNKSLVSSASIKIFLKSNLFIPIVCESFRYCIIERVNFVVKILYGSRSLTFNKVLMISTFFTSGVRFAAYT